MCGAGGDIVCVYMYIVRCKCTVYAVLYMIMYK